MQDGEDYSQLPLKEILEMEDMELEEVLAIPGIHTKIKINMKIFIQYCLQHPNFTQRFINIGLKCPMHESNNQQMKQFTFIAADVLTSDHETLADLFIINPTKQHEGEEQIEEEIETEEQISVPPQKKYMFLISLFEYLNSPELDENCVNYISKTLATLVRKKISEYLEFFIQHPECLNRLVEISTYPSIAHLLAKMLTDDDDGLTDRAFSIKQRIIPALLEKIHQNMDKKETLDIFQGIEDILNATRYADSEERNPLQKMSDYMVSEKELSFFMKTLFGALEEGEKTHEMFHVLHNAVTYISLVLTRLNMDEQHDFTYNNEPQEFNPTLEYQIDNYFLQFCKIVINVERVWEYRDIVGTVFGIVPIKVMEPLTLMTKHSRFSSFYEKIPKFERTYALQAILRILCTISMNGVLLQSTTALLEKMLLQQEKIAQSQAQIVLPDDLYLSISEYAGSVGGSIATLLEQNKKQRNRNERGIYYRKILLLLDNYFKNSAVEKRYPKTCQLQNLFPAFNMHNNKLYAEKTQVLDHPGGEKRKLVEQCKFIGKNRQIIRTTSPDLETYPEPEVKEDPKEIYKQKVNLINMKLADKFNRRAQLVKQQNTDKDLAKPTQDGNNLRQQQNPPPSQNQHPPLPSQQNQQSPSKKQSQEKESLRDKRSQQSKESSQQELVRKRSPSQTGNPKSEEQSQSQCRSREPTGLTFFIRHLMIY